MLHNRLRTFRKHLTNWITRRFARRETSDLKHDALTLDEVKVRVDTDAAISICRLVQDATYRCGAVFPGGCFAGAHASP